MRFLFYQPFHRYHFQDYAFCVIIINEKVGKEWDVGSEVHRANCFRTYVHLFNLRFFNLDLHSKLV